MPTAFNYNFVIVRIKIRQFYQLTKLTCLQEMSLQVFILLVHLNYLIHINPVNFMMI